MNQERIVVYCCVDVPEKSAIDNMVKIIRGNCKTFASVLQWCSKHNEVIEPDG